MKETKRILWTQVLCFTLSLLLLLGGCSSGGGETVETLSPGETTALSSDSGDSAGADSSADGKDEEAVPSSGAGLLTVSFLDVGQGDSALIELPNGEIMLIDAGEAEYAQAVVDYIHSRDISKIDYLVATHPHSDHIGGLAEVVSLFEVGAVYMPKVQNNTRIFEKLLRTIKDKGLTITTTRAGVSMISQPGLTADIVAPCGDSYSDLNNYSIVLRLVYGETAFLFTGDAEIKSEEEIGADIKADVLKVGHHGSGYSSGEAFLERVSPDYAVISCGEGNKYGHPESAALQRLSAAGAEIRRTDLEGTIVIESDGSRLFPDKKSSPLKENAPPADGLNTSATDGGLKSKTADSAPENEVTVYVTKTGTKYHRGDCSYLSKSKLPISLEEARGVYEPCSRCNPPQ